jgi:hypothetical protein
MNTIEIALKYVDVALPETCQKLDWQSKTHFYWFDGKLCDRLRFNSLVGLWFAQPIDDDGLTFFKSENKVDFIPAPQVHEIAPLLPEILYYLNRKFITKIAFDLIVSETRKTEIEQFGEYAGILRSYPHDKKIPCLLKISRILNDEPNSISLNYSFEPLSIQIKNHHYAESYAELYLQLKEKGLISL